MRTSRWTAVFAVAASQHGAIARRQIRTCGVDEATFTRRVRAERWSQPHRGVYLLPGSHWTSATRVCIECDSLAYHGDQRSIDLDHRKDQAYASVWWRCLRIGWRRHDLDWSGFTAVLEVALMDWPSVWRGRVL